MALTGGLSPLAHGLSTGRLGCPYDMAGSWHSSKIREAQRWRKGGRNQSKSYDVFYDHPWKPQSFISTLSYWLHDEPYAMCKERIQRQRCDSQEVNIIEGHLGVSCHTYYRKNTYFHFIVHLPLIGWRNRGQTFTVFFLQRTDQLQRLTVFCVPQICINWMRNKLLY